MQEAAALLLATPLRQRVAAALAVVALVVLLPTAQAAQPGPMAGLLVAVPLMVPLTLRLAVVVVGLVLQLETLRGVPVAMRSSVVLVVPLAVGLALPPTITGPLVEEHIMSAELRAQLPEQ